ncbi:MAG: MFS transporter [Legionella sp.]|nr:MFS transporter [Legionella sp.]
MSVFLFVSNLNLTAINLALPEIRSALHVEMMVIQWVMSAYMIAAGLLMISGGRLSDRFGAPNLFLWSQLLWCVSLLGSACAPSIEWLIIARIIGGIAFAFGLPASMVILMRAFPEEKLHIPVSINMVITGFAQAIGPTLSGYVLTHLGWRWMFGLNLPLVFFALCVSVLLPSERVVNSKTKGGGRALFYNRIFVLMNVLRALFQLIYFALFFALPFYFFDRLNLSPIDAGLLMLCLTLTFALTAPLIGQLAKRWGEPSFITLGFVLQGLVFFILGNFTAQMTIGWLVVVLMLTGFSAACIYSISTIVALRVISPDRKGLATGVFFTNALIGSALGVTLGGFILQHYTFATMMFVGSVIACLGGYLSLYQWVQVPILNRVLMGRDSLARAIDKNT